MPTVYQIRKDTVVIDNGYPRGKLTLTRTGEHISIRLQVDITKVKVRVHANDLWRALQRIQVI